MRKYADLAWDALIATCSLKVRFPLKYIPNHFTRLLGRISISPGRVKENLLASLAVVKWISSVLAISNNIALFFPTSINRFTSRSKTLIFLL